MGTPRRSSSRELPRWAATTILIVSALAAGGLVWWWIAFGSATVHVN